MEAPARPVRGARLWSALPDFAIAGAFLVTWIAPETFGAPAASTLIMMMLAEFPVAFAVGLVGIISSQRRVSKRVQVFATAFYGVPVGLAVGLGFAGSVTVVFTTWAQIFNRLSPILLQRPSRETATRIAYRHVIAALGLWFLTALVLAALAWFLPVPALGLNSQTADLSSLRFGIGRDRPEAFIIWGIVYFSAMGLAELLWLSRGFATTWKGVKTRWEP